MKNVIGMLMTLAVTLAFLPTASAQTVELWSTNIGGAYDDSHQVDCHMENAGIFGLPSPHCRTRALRHELRLVINGPNDANLRQAINGCVQQGAIVGAVAGVGGAVATGGVAVGAAVQTFINYVATCVGGYAAQSITANINNDSHWVTY